MKYPRKTVGVGLIVAFLGGCATTGPTGNVVSQRELRRRAMECLRAAVDFRPNTAVRVAAVEALETCPCAQSLPWIRTALLDEHPAVRFAGCVAIGNLRDTVAETAIRDRLSDDDPSVRAAALFAMHRLGHTEQTGELATYLLKHEDPAVRRNAAMVLGMFEEPGVVKLLARAMRDSDAGVRDHALEAMARLGNRDAKKELTFVTSAGIGSEEVFAVCALAATRDRTYADTYRYKLSAAPHLETRLAAAYGLGLLGSDEGFALAMRALRLRKAPTRDPNDSPAGQLLRIHQLAAKALGAIGRADALPLLRDHMENQNDPRLQVSAARAVLEIVEANEDDGLPFACETGIRR